MTAVVLGLGLSGPDPGGKCTAYQADDGRVLDFHDRTVGEVVRAIEDRSGKRVVAYGAGRRAASGTVQIKGPVDSSRHDRTVTLESPGPVPFWEAIDRLAVAGRLTYRLGDFGESTGVVFEGDGDAPGPACYAGPFRIGLLGATSIARSSSSEGHGSGSIRRAFQPRPTRPT